MSSKSLKSTQKPAIRHWLMKSEPDTFSIDDLKAKKRSLWDGVRNYQARNFMMNEMRPGDLILFYHSSATPPGVAGLAKVSKTAVPDPTAQDPKSKYYDPKAAPEKPIWFCVEVEFTAKFKDLVPLDELKKHKALNDMLVLKRGQRLSIQPVTPKEYDFIVGLAKD